ncbi:MAG: hypothetical protein AEth_00026 [Candidatus Argoarchaeum ethanivorans]|uniref:Cellobiose phosphorylase n=1 Tax=Candidatus Argoarchaeum ethanivorans TaxID=2608793 RepID=A0A8B3S4Q0_9EURY|nr:MAG: hypothetical protein AEth_00026 [Candidatus Argoarchaeum ethanivorans]
MVNKENVRYYLDSEKRFVIENYNWAKPFSSFFPGIGGKWGVPLWAYYVNRGQCVSSIGVRDKDDAIMEFFSFNKACQMVGNQGFRTFLKVDGDVLYEPFKQSKNEMVSQRMIVSAWDLELEEVNRALGLRVTVNFFPLVNLSVAGLVRMVSIKNLNGESLRAELLDGLPHILSFGMTQRCIKIIARHIEAMKEVEVIDGMPLFKLKQVPLDVPEVQEIRGGNFYFTLLDGKGSIPSDSYVVDPESVFGVSWSFDYPWLFAEHGVEEVLACNQMYENKTPCAFTVLCLDIPAGKEMTFYSIVGNASSEEKLRSFKKYVVDNGILDKRDENKRTIEEIEDNMFTVSSNKNFDSYCGQTFLDNVVRGGMPVVFRTQSSKNVFYLYSRKHGDLERDYNYFVVEETYLSQGNSHFRDVNQNRRNDAWFNPGIEDSNIIMFFNLIQTDGFNPLVVNGLTYTATDLPALAEWLGRLVDDTGLFDELLELVKEPFTPGEFMMKIEEAVTGRSLDYDEIISVLLSFSRENDVGEPSEGFWIDHWTYNLDLLDNFLMSFPDRLKEILVDKSVFTFYDNPDVVMPRNKKYVLVDGNVRQYGSVKRNKDKLKLIKSREADPYKVRREYGRGSVYTTNLLVKMLLIIANKIASLDPEGIGMEMEADKPGWNDPLNGLPGLLASSLSETLELKRACSFLSDAIVSIGLEDSGSVSIFEELDIFITDLMETIEKRLDSVDENRKFLFWDESHRIKEDYREKAIFGVSGGEAEMKISTVKDFLDKSLKLLDSIFSEIPKDKVFHKNGVCYTYFLNEVKRYEHIHKDDEENGIAVNDSGLELVTPLEFKQKPLSLFLEGPVHLMKIKQELASEIYKNVKNSEIYDEKLKMYKTSEPITRETSEIGRARAYTPGWIENESIYLHMEYKYLLELLKAGLHKEYYEEIRNTMIPFLDPETYGRSILENSSFIVSSAFPDSKLYGRGFQPRLTGASAELINMWTIMTAGQHPFFVDETGNLELKLEPALPGWLFTEKKQTCKTFADNGDKKELIIPENCFAFKFLGKTIVVYHNDKRKNTFGKDKARITHYTLKYTDGKTCKIQGSTIPEKPANDTRNGQIERIDAFLH